MDTITMRLKAQQLTETLDQANKLMMELWNAGCRVEANQCAIVSSGMFDPKGSSPALFKVAVFQQISKA